MSAGEIINMCNGAGGNESENSNISWHQCRKWHLAKMDVAISRNGVMAINK
jgi:hypothetical protein